MELLDQKIMYVQVLVLTDEKSFWVLKFVTMTQCNSSVIMALTSLKDKRSTGTKLTRQIASPVSLCTKTADCAP